MVHNNFHQIDRLGLNYKIQTPYSRGEADTLLVNEASKTCIQEVQEGNTVFNITKFFTEMNDIKQDIKEDLQHLTDPNDKKIGKMFLEEIESIQNLLNEYSKEHGGVHTIPLEDLNPALYDKRPELSESVSPVQPASKPTDLKQVLIKDGGMALKTMVGQLLAHHMPNPSIWDNLSIDGAKNFVQNAFVTLLQEGKFNWSTLELTLVKTGHGAEKDFIMNRLREYTKTSTPLPDLPFGNQQSRILTRAFADMLVKDGEPNLERLINKWLVPAFQLEIRQDVNKNILNGNYSK